MANDIAFHIAIEEKVKEGGYIHFYGDDFCENCMGWDMTSNRCYCGNRRVGWEHDGNFEDIQIYAQGN